MTGKVICSSKHYLKPCMRTTDKVTKTKNKQTKKQKEKPHKEVLCLSGKCLHSFLLGKTLCDLAFQVQPLQRFDSPILRELMTVFFSFDKAHALNYLKVFLAQEKTSRAEE